MDGRHRWLRYKAKHGLFAGGASAVTLSRVRAASRSQLLGLVMLVVMIGTFSWFAFWATSTTHGTETVAAVHHEAGSEPADARTILTFANGLRLDVAGNLDIVPGDDVVQHRYGGAADGIYVDGRFLPAAGTRGFQWFILIPVFFLMLTGTMLCRTVVTLVTLSGLRRAVQADLQADRAGVSRERTEHAEYQGSWAPKSFTAAQSRSRPLLGGSSGVPIALHGPDGMFWCFVPVSQYRDLVRFEESIVGGDQRVDVTFRPATRSIVELREASGDAILVLEPDEATEPSPAIPVRFGRRRSA